jgi:hypothetical protein
VRTGRKQDQIQVIVVANAGEGHDESKPSPLPKYANKTTTVTAETNYENDMGIGVLDFAKVDYYSIVTAENKLVGVSFFDANDDCLATVKFREPLDKVNQHSAVHGNWGTLRGHGVPFNVDWASRCKRHLAMYL